MHASLCFSSFITVVSPTCLRRSSNKTMFKVNSNTAGVLPYRRTLSILPNFKLSPGCSFITQFQCLFIYLFCVDFFSLFSWSCLYFGNVNILFLVTDETLASVLYNVHDGFVYVLGVVIVVYVTERYLNKKYMTIN